MRIFAIVLHEANSEVAERIETEYPNYFKSPTPLSGDAITEETSCARFSGIRFKSRVF